MRLLDITVFIALFCSDFDDLDITYLDEEIVAFDPPDTRDFEDIPSGDGIKVLTSADVAVNDLAAIAYESCLRELANVRVGSHCPIKKCGKPYTLGVSHVGTAMYMTWVSTNLYIILYIIFVHYFWVYVSVFSISVMFFFVYACRPPAKVTLVIDGHHSHD